MSYHSDEIFLYKPEENSEIVASLDHAVHAYINELSRLNKAVHPRGVEVLVDFFSNRLSETFKELRNSSEIALGETITFITNSWQSRVAGFEGKEFIITEKFVDAFGRVEYLLKSADKSFLTFWATEELLRAIKTNTVDKFVYISTLVSREPDTHAGF